MPLTLDSARRRRARFVRLAPVPTIGLRRERRIGRGRERARALVHDIDWDALEPRGSYARVGRRALDLLLLGACAAPALALGALVALANLAAFGDPRKVLFTQPRVGRRGRVFRIYKFRTMRDPVRSAHASWRSGEDRARVTGLGRLLRNTHLDELPQLLNVARGEMSFVGPRPEMVEIERWAARHVPGFTERLVVRPGITGWAQITQGYTGFSIEAYTRKLELAAHDARDPSPRRDVEVLARTAVWMLRGRGWSWNKTAAAAAPAPAERRHALPRPARVRQR